MQSFFFHVRVADELILDPEGSVLPDLSAAKREALVSLRHLMADRLRNARSLDVQQIEIADLTGQILATVNYEDALGTLQ